MFRVRAPVRAWLPAYTHSVRRHTQRALRRSGHAMAHGRIRTLMVAFLVALRCVSAAVVTRQGEAAPCSLLINSATAIRQQGELDGKSAGIEALSGILVRDQCCLSLCR